MLCDLLYFTAQGKEGKIKPIFSASSCGAYPSQGLVLVDRYLQSLCLTVRTKRGTPACPGNLLLFQGSLLEFIGSGIKARIYLVSLQMIWN